MRQSDGNIGRGGGENGGGVEKWHLDISQKTNFYPGHSYDKLRGLITTTVGQKLASAVLSGLTNSTTEEK